jgi:hypothetical protein
MPRAENPKIPHNTRNDKRKTSIEKFAENYTGRLDGLEKAVEARWRKSEGYKKSLKEGRLRKMLRRVKDQREMEV